MFSSDLRVTYKRPRIVKNTTVPIGSNEEQCISHKRAVNRRCVSLDERKNLTLSAIFTFLLCGSADPRVDVDELRFLSSTPEATIPFALKIKDPAVAELLRLMLLAFTPRRTGLRTVAKESDGEMGEVLVSTNSVFSSSDSSEYLLPLTVTSFR